MKEEKDKEDIFIINETDESYIIWENEPESGVPDSIDDITNDALNDLEYLRDVIGYAIDEFSAEYEQICKNFKQNCLKYSKAKGINAGESDLKAKEGVQKTLDHDDYSQK